MADFMFLFRGTPATQRSTSPEQLQQTLQKWMSWMETLKKSGNVKHMGERLDGSGKVVRGRVKAVTDGPYVEAKDAVGGYMLVSAKDITQAVELSKGCPILEADGTVEIRPIMSM